MQFSTEEHVPGNNLPFDPHCVHFGEGDNAASGWGEGEGEGLGFGIEEHDLQFIKAVK